MSRSPATWHRCARAAACLAWWKPTTSAPTCSSSAARARDRTWRNPNLLVWHGGSWLIDHGAALYFHHDWLRASPAKPFDARQHVVRDRAVRIAQAHERLAPRVTASVLERVTRDVPEEWFGERGADAYVSQLLDRAPLVPEVIRR